MSNPTSKNKIQAFMDSESKSRDRWIRKAKFYYNDILKLFRYHIPSSESILEIGCGTGNLIGNMDAKRLIGIDIAEKMVKRARYNFPKEKYPNIEFMQMDAEKITLKEKFDHIILSDTVGYFEDVQKVFSNIKPLTHEGTRLIITYQNFLWDGFLGILEILHLKMPTKKIKLNWLEIEDITNLLNLTGFEVVKTGKRMLFPIYIPLISMLINRFLANLPLVNHFCLTTYVIARPVITEKRELSVSIVIPARNEKGNIEEAIKRLPRFGKWQEIIFVEGHSSDGTLEEIERVQKKYKNTHKIMSFRQEGKGKGDAVRKGFDNATGDILMILDADLTVPPEDLPKFYEAIAQGKGEFINGCRLVYPLEKEAMRFLNILGNKFFSVMFSWLLSQRVKDTLCGTKVLTKENWKKITANRKYFGEFDPFGDYDLIFGATKLDLKYIEIPIRYKARTYGSTNISRFKHGWLLIKMVFFAMGKIKFI
jgi:SAM-dependent methyltransferase